MDKFCPLSFIGRGMGVPLKTCVEQHCMIWDEEQKKCLLVIHLWHLLEGVNAKRIV